MTLLEWTELDWRTAFSAVSIVILAAAEYYARLIPQGKRFGLISLLSAGLILTSVWMPSELVRIILLSAAGLLLVCLIWPQNQPAGRWFLAASATGSLLVAGGLALSGMFAGALIEPAGMIGKVVICMVFIGYAIKLALLPFSLWLVSISEKCSVMSAVLVISLLDMAELGELAALRVVAPWIFEQAMGVWIGLAVLCMLGGALLALAQTNLRRMLAYSTIDDMGYLILGLAAGSAGGVMGALVGALSHALCKFLLFGALGVAEHDLGHPLTTADRGVATRQPAASAAFIAGALGMVGVPPLLGFIGRWRLYLGGIELGGVWLAILMASATTLALLYYVRVIHKVWLGQITEEPVTAPMRLRTLEGVLIGFIILLVIGGFSPVIFPVLSGR